MSGQNQERGVRIGLTLGLDHTVTQDRLVSPLRFAGSGVGLGRLSVSQGNERYRNAFGLWLRTRAVSSGSFTYTVDGSPVETPRSTGTLGEAYFVHTRSVAPRWALGVAGRFHVAHTEYELGAGSADGFLYTGSLEAVGRASLLEGMDGRLTLEVCLPLVTWTARPSFTTVDEARLKASHDFLYRLGQGGIAWPGEFWAFMASIRYDHGLTDRVESRVALELAHRRVGHPKTFRSLNASLEWGLGLRFGAER